MHKEPLTLIDLASAARDFCNWSHQYRELFGVTDGKAVGTFIELQFRTELEAKYDVLTGNSARGLDLPSLDTDIKATSVRQPQSSCPFRSARQKIYGLGYHLLLFVYEKHDEQKKKTATLNFVNCVFIDRSRTADYQTTRGLRDLLDRDANRDDIMAFLEERRLPGDEIVFNNLADEILTSPPELGYLTISNALQWRLQYGRVINVAGTIPGVEKVV